jgi:hypothetical protein
MPWIRLGEAARSVVAKAAPRREPSGRRARLAKADDAVVAATAAQPHRRGERTTAAATPWQRLIRATWIADPSGRFTPGQLEEAGLRFAAARLNYLAAIGAPFGWANAVASGRDMSPARRRQWVADWLTLVETLTRTQYRALCRAVDSHPEDEERLWSAEQVVAVRDGLRALASHFNTAGSRTRAP